MTLLVVFLVWRIGRHHWGVSSVRRPALVLSGALLVQLLLGALTIWTRKAVVPTTAHVVFGAVVFASSLVLTLRAWRLAPSSVKSGHVEMRPRSVPGAAELQLNSGES